MATSSILGGDKAPVPPEGKDSEALGPSDSSDSGSDSVGVAKGDSDAAGTGERASATGDDQEDGADIVPDRIIERGGARKPPAGARRPSDVREYAAEEERSRDA